MQHPGNLECFSFGTCMLEVGFLGYDQYNVDMCTSWWQPSLELNVERRLSEWSEVISAIFRIIKLATACSHAHAKGIKNKYGKL